MAVSRRRLTVRLIQVAIAVALIALWQAIGSGSKTLGLTVGTPVEVVRWMADWAAGGSLPHGNGWSDLGLTLRTTTLGYALGATSGAIAGSIVGGVRWLRDVTAPFVGMLNAFPKIALAPLFVVIFGASSAMQVYFVAASVFFITFYAVYHGLQGIDVLHLRNARMLGASRLWRLRVVYVPSTLGWLMSGLRLTAAWSLSATVVVEYLTSGESGMGGVVSSGQAADNVPQVIGGMAIVSLVALLVDRLLVGGGRRMMKWRSA